MDDKELLMLAAKAAGIKFELKWYGVDWNPLHDDADAFRLAVKLKMDVTVGQSVKVVCATNDYGASRVVLALGDDPCAATRRAIIEAAAEIGKKMDAPAVLG